MIIDSHCHLDFEAYEDDLDVTIQRAREKGIGGMLTVATDKREYPELIALIEKYPFIYGAFGIHPDSIDINHMPTVTELVQMLHHLKIIGVGETGLDYHFENIDKKYQKESFHTHIEVARQTELPIIIHVREADDDFMGILQEEMRYKPFTGMIHCFSSSEKVAKVALDLGLYLSLSGIITFQKAEDLRAIVEKLPTDRLLVETDAPYLAPVPYRGQRNEPAFITETVNTLAKLKNISVDTLTDTLTANFFSLFRHRINLELFK